MKKEIGGDFEISLDILFDRSPIKEIQLLDYLNKKINDIVYLANGRTAIKLILLNILRKREVKRIWLPSYLCETVIQPFRELNIRYEFYNLNEELEIDIRYLIRKIKRGDLLFITYYFGFLPSYEIIEFLLELKSSGFIIIKDATHSFLSEVKNNEKESHYEIISLRKWFAIPEGGVAISFNDIFSKELKYEKPLSSFAYLRFVASLLKYLYLNEMIEDKDYFRKMYEKAEKIACGEIKLNIMSDLSFKLLKGLNLKEICKKRRSNYLYLLKNLKFNKMISPLFNHFDEKICPIGFPIICKERNKLRKYLVENNIYCPIHWQISDYITNKFSFSNYISKHIMTIPCDQRYTIIDMDYIIKIIERYIG
jgi:dTDP-4-amino-4,6-dideoxygalactose transaminase